MKLDDEFAMSGVSHFRIAFVGDPRSGKSEVRRAYVQLSTAKESIEQVDSNVARVKGFLVELLTVDRESEFEKIPHMNRCSHLDAIFLFYDVTNPTQFERAHNQWIPLIKRLYQGTPLVLCATGIECRMDKNQRETALRMQVDMLKKWLRKEQSSDDSSSSSTEPTTVEATASDSSSSIASRSSSATSTATATTTGRSKPRGRHDSLESVPASPSVLRRAPLSPTKIQLNPKSSAGFRKLVPSQLGKQLAFHYGASAFKEVSYRTFEGIQELLEETIVHIVRADKVKFSLVRSRVGLPLPRHTYRLT